MPISTGYVQGFPRQILRVEGAAFLVVSVFGYAHLGHSWRLFVILFLVPDLSMLGYLSNARAGAILYNAAHTFAVPLALAALAVVCSASLILALAMIWVAHIGFDRMLGYGLKYGSAFTDTHLGRIGRQRPESTS